MRIGVCDMSFPEIIKKTSSILIAFSRSLIVLEQVVLLSAMSRFEWHWIQWSELEELDSSAEWDVWERHKEFKWLAPGQETRHRLNDKILFMGDGMRSCKFKEISHRVMEHRPTWSLRLGLKYHIKAITANNKLKVETHAGVCFSNIGPFGKKMIEGLRLAIEFQVLSSSIWRDVCGAPPWKSSRNIVVHLSVGPRQQENEGHQTYNWRCDRRSSRTLGAARYLFRGAVADGLEDYIYGAMPMQ